MNYSADDGNQAAQRRARLGHADRMLHDRKYRLLHDPRHQAYLRELEQWEQYYTRLTGGSSAHSDDEDGQRSASLRHAERLLHDREYRLQFEQWKRQQRLTPGPGSDEEDAFAVRARRFDTAARATGSGKCTEQRFYKPDPGYALRVRSFALD